jgi:hypothetical protein
MTTSEGGQRDAEGSSRVVVRVEWDLLDEAAKRRAEQVIQKALDDELAQQPLPERVGGGGGGGTATFGMKPVSTGRRR